MEKFIPFEKLSKKEQQKRNDARRGSWHGLNPVTRKPDNAKAYNRRKAQKWSEDSGSVPFAISEGSGFSFSSLTKLSVLNAAVILCILRRRIRVADTEEMSCITALAEVQCDRQKCETLPAPSR